MKAAKDADAPVLLMGHGIINRYIAKELLASGWKEQTRPRTGYWGAGIYSRYPPGKAYFSINCSRPRDNEWRTASVSTPICA